MSCVSVNRSMVSWKPRHVQAGRLSHGNFKRQKLPMKGGISAAGRCNRTLPSSSLDASLCAGRVPCLVAVINADNQQDSRLLADSGKAGHWSPSLLELTVLNLSASVSNEESGQSFFCARPRLRSSSVCKIPRTPGLNLCCPKNSPDSLTSCSEFSTFPVTITTCHSLHDSV